VQAPGTTPARRNAVVAVGRDTQVDVLVGVAVSESLTVIAVTPIVDVRSSDASVTVTDTKFNALPLEHSYRGLFQLAPGVPTTAARWGCRPAAAARTTPSSDGANITSPGFGTLAIQVNQLDIAEINLTRGVTAEFAAPRAPWPTPSAAADRTGFGAGRVDWLPERLVAWLGSRRSEAAGLRPGTFRDPLLTSQAEPAPASAARSSTISSSSTAPRATSTTPSGGGSTRPMSRCPTRSERARSISARSRRASSASHQLTVSHRDHPIDVDSNGLTSDTRRRGHGGRPQQPGHGTRLGVVSTGRGGR
jgi:hypothetical protein